MQTQRRFGQQALSNVVLRRERQIPEVFQGSNLTTESADAIAVELGPLDDVVELLLQQLLVQPRDLVPGRDLEFVEDVGHLTQPS